MRVRGPRVVDRVIAEDKPRRSTFDRLAQTDSGEPRADGSLCAYEFEVAEAEASPRGLPSAF